ncbi:unnamed protein product, partial [Didymodactylos carnosus]
DWESAASLSHLSIQWASFKKSTSFEEFLFLQMLCFNVRGLNLRWGEVCQLTYKHKFDLLILGEVEQVDFSLINAAFPNHLCFYQAGENPHGGVIALIRSGLPISRVPCVLPNIVVFDMHLNETVRIIAMYAPESKSWNWMDLSSLITTRCVVMGDFNVDLDDPKDKISADNLLTWMDSCMLDAFVPGMPTSLRSDRTIDYAVANGLDVTIQVLAVPTSSDHLPLICTLA